MEEIKNMKHMKNIIKFFCENTLTEFIAQQFLLCKFPIPISILLFLIIN